MKHTKSMCKAITVWHQPNPLLFSLKQGMSITFFLTDLPGNPKSAKEDRLRVCRVELSCRAETE